MSELNSILDRTLSTNDFAAAIGVRPYSIHHHRSRTGGDAYCGIEPIRLPNGYLRWPRSAVERLMPEQEVS